MTRLHLQIALDSGTLEDAVRITRLTLPYADSIEVGTPLLLREGIAAIHKVREARTDASKPLFADTKIFDEGHTIAHLCFEAGADAISVVDGASTITLEAVWHVAQTLKRQVWVDLIYHSNPILRARTLLPYVDGFVIHRPAHGFPPLLLEGLLALDRPVRMAGGLTLEFLQREVQKPRSDITAQDGIIVGRAITQAEDVEATAKAFAALCHAV